MPGGTHCESINIYMVGVCVHANPADGQITQFANDFKFCWGLTSSRQLIQDIRTRCSQELPSRMAENGKKYIAYTTSAKSWRLCVLASLPTSGPALRDVQIEQWSINQRALTKYTAFLHTGCIFELGIGMPLSSVL